MLKHRVLNENGKILVGKNNLEKARLAEKQGSELG